jgi:hypothetical protein
MVRLLRLVALLVVACGGTALAQPADPQPLETFMPNPVTWLEEAHRFVRDNRLAEGVETLSYALVFALLLYGAIRAGYFGRSSEFRALFARLLLAGALLLGTPAIRTVAQDTWASVYGWSSGIWARQLNAELGAAAGNLGAQLAGVWGAASVARIAGAKLTGLTAKRLAEGGAGAAAQAASSGDRLGLLRTLLNLSSLLLSPLIGVYAALIFLSGLVVLLALVFLPLSAALLMVPGGDGWIGRWVGAYAGAVFTVAFLPLVFGVAVKLGLIEPMNRLNAEISSLNAELIGLVQATAAEQKNLVPGSAFDALSRLFDGSYWASLGEALSRIMQMLLAWVVSLVSMVIGLVVGALLLLNLERQVAAFVGGLANGFAAPAILPLGRMGGGRAQGGGSSTSNTAPASASTGTGSSSPAASPAPLPPPGGPRQTNAPEPVVSRGP